MKTQIRITDESLFNQMIDEVEVDGLRTMQVRGGFYQSSGDMRITFANGGSQIYSGEFGMNDYREDFGFQIIGSEE